MFPSAKFIFFIASLLFSFTSFHVVAKNFNILTEEFPPYNYLDNGQVSGISTEITQEILNRLNISDNIRLMPWSTAYKLIQEQNNTILFSTTRTPAREKLFKWVGPLVPNNTVFFARKNAGIIIKNLDDAKKTNSIGVYKEDFGELLLKAKGFKNLDSVKDNRQNVTKLINGEIDLWIINEITGKHMLREAGLLNQVEKIYNVQKDYMYIAFNKEIPDAVVKKWQKVLDEIKSDGTYAQIFSNWIMFSYSNDLKPRQSNHILLSQQEKQWIKLHPTIRVATDPDYAPFQYKDQNNISQGLANDYLALIEKKLGLDFDLLPSNNWNTSLESVKNRQADMVVVAAKTSLREEYMSFTSPYVSFADVIITREHSSEINSIVELHGKKLATIEGFAINDYIKKYYPKVELVFKADVASVLNSVSMGEVEATVLNVATASYAIEKANITNLHIGGNTGFAYELSFASRKDWPMLNNLLKKSLSSISAKERKELLRKWISISYIPGGSEQDSHIVQLTNEEETWLKNHPILSAAPDPDWAPVEFFDKNGKYSGMTADYVKLLEKRLGVKFHILHLNNWDEIVQKVKAGEIDLLTAASITPNRKKKLLFTKPFLKLKSVIVVNKKESGRLTMDDLNGKVVAVVSGYANQEHMQKEFPDIHLKLVSSEKEALQQVAYGKAYAYVGSVATISYLIEKEMMVNLRIAGEESYIWNLGMASNKQIPILNQILAKGLASITKQERQAIISKWVLINKQSWRPSKEFIIALLIILALFFVISIIVWNWLLRKKVKIRTLELNQSLRLSEKLREKADNAQLLAEQANLAKSKLFAAASHDLRQPLHAIGLFVSTLKLNYHKQDKEKDDHVFAMINKSLSSQKELFNTLLDVSKLDAGAIKANIKHFYISRLCEELESEFSILAKDKNLNLFVNFVDDMIVKSDELILKRILKNLLSNAIRYSQYGNINLSVKNLDKELLFSVVDSGQGISQQEQAKIYTEFYQIESALNSPSGNRQNKGLGLGLSIVLKLINLLGTKIDLFSELEKGSTFSFTLPSGLSEKVIERRINREPLNNWDLSEAKILIIDDDEVILNAMKYQLESWECIVNSFSCYQDSLAYIDESEYIPDLILMDYHLQDGVTGIQVLSDLLSKFQIDIPTIFISADVSTDNTLEITDAGFKLLHKPVSPAVLRMAIQKQLKALSE
ncbi:MAG: transporter substrate-binding domain-containing protein [Pseudomonadota bacterium]